VVGIELFADVELFADFSDEETALVAAAAETRTLRRGDVLFTEGPEPAHELFIVVRGRVAISNRSVDGRESVVALMEAGQTFGEMGLFLPGRSAEARALERAEVVGVR
jgi:CRP-like cAMP-binding protein